MHEVDSIVTLMSHDHIFIDAYGNIQSKETMRQGWPGYFSWFPDYLIEANDVFESGKIVVILGFASGTYHGKTTPDNQYHWRIPAAWRAVIDNNNVRVWQVYADTKIPFDIINEVQTQGYE